jgi:hypothetical protein
VNTKLLAIRGKQFVHPKTKVIYGLFRLPSEVVNFSTLDKRQYQALAEDECGNYIAELESGSVWFWDHETDAMEKLAESVPEFIGACTDPTPIEVDPTQVESVWIDPALAKQLGISAPPDGWIKKKT